MEREYSHELSFLLKLCETDALWSVAEVKEIKHILRLKAFH